MLDETKIPLDYMKEKHEWTPNKAELASIKRGAEIDGVALVENESLRGKIMKKSGVFQN